jgi:hypothetical protein
MGLCGVYAALVAVFVGSLVTVLEMRHAESPEFQPAGAAPLLVAATSAGDVELPIRYYDGTAVAAFYGLAPSVAQALLPDELEPLLVPGIGAVGGIFMFEYRNTSIGEYLELGLAIQTVQKGVHRLPGAALPAYLWDLFAHLYHLPGLLDIFHAEHTGLYVVTLPVTTEAAKAAGRDIWGFNKYVTSATADFTDPKRAVFELEGELAFEMEASALGLTTAGLPYLTYSQKDGKLIRTAVHVGNKIRWGHQSVTLKYLGNGTTSERMQALGMFDKAPLATYRSDALKAILPHGTEIESPEFSI